MKKELEILILIGIIFGCMFKLLNSIIDKEIIEIVVFIFIIIEDYILYNVYLKRKINMDFGYYSILGIIISFITYITLIGMTKWI